MTDAQNDALEKIRDLIREHFEAGVIMVEDEQWREVMWHGGISSALGLCDIAKCRLMYRATEAFNQENEND